MNNSLEYTFEAIRCQHSAVLVSQNLTLDIVQPDHPQCFSQNLRFTFVMDSERTHRFICQLSNGCFMPIYVKGACLEW